MATVDRNFPKPSVSFLSEVIRSNSNDALHCSRDADYRQLNRRLLRIQIFLVVLGLTLLITSAVALIEERKILGLGFGVCGALSAIFTALFVVTSCDLKMLGLINAASLLINTVTVFFIVESFYRYLTQEIDEHTLTNFGMVYTLCLVEFAHVFPIMLAVTYNLVLLRQLHLYKANYETP